MAKLFLLSIIIALLSLPARAAHMANARAGLKKAFLHVGIYFTLYLIGLKFIFGKSGAVHAVYMLIVVLIFRYALPVRAERR
jgi:hypothetical protein